MKPSKLYDGQSFADLSASANKSIFKDASTGIALARNLIAIDPKILTKQYAELSLVNSGITVSNYGGYANKIETLRVSEEGDFALASDLSDGAGKISISAENSLLDVFQYKGTSSWSDTEIKQAQMASQGNIKLVDRFIQTKRKLYLQKVDAIGYLGHAGTSGLLNTPFFTNTVATGAIATLTPQQAYNEIATLITDQRNIVNNTPAYSCDTVVLPTTILNKLNTLILNTAAGSSTVMKALQDNFKDVKFVSSFRANNVGGASKVVAYSTNEDAMVMRIPVPLTIGEIIRDGSFEYAVDSMFRIAGIDILEPSSGRILTGL